MSNLTPGFRDYITGQLMANNSKAAQEFIGRLEDPCNNSEPMTSNLTDEINRIINDSEQALYFKKIIEAYSATDRPRPSRGLLDVFKRVIDPAFYLELIHRLDLECTPDVEMSTYFFIPGNFTIGDLTAGAFGVQVISNAAGNFQQFLTSVFPQAGEISWAAGGTFPYFTVIWIECPTGTEPIGWRWNPDGSGDVDVAWTVLNSPSLYKCYEVVIDLSLIPETTANTFPAPITSVLGDFICVSGSQEVYSDPTFPAIFEGLCQIALGNLCTTSVTLDSATQVTIRLFDVPIKPTDIITNTFGSYDQIQTDAISEIPCP